MIGVFRGDNHFLSNFYPCEIVEDDIIYSSVEHYYIAMKVNTSVLFQKKRYTVNEFRVMVSELDNASLVKKVGESIKPRNDWKQYRFIVMKFGITEKFKNKELRRKLIATGNQELVEGNWWHDNYFGSCFCDKCKNIDGKNMLGKMIMDVRDEITGNGKKGLEQIFF